MYFIVKTPNNTLRIDVYSKFIKKSDVKRDKNLFSGLCKDCRNYDGKYSCPPASPSFDSLCKDKGLFVVVLKCGLINIKSTEYNKVRLANSVLKSRIERIMRALETFTSTKFFSSGSCRLCKDCAYTSKMPCRYPDKMRYSLESIGVDCNYLSRQLFNTPLLWFKEGIAPEYTCVVAGLPCKESMVESLTKGLSKVI